MDIKYIDMISKNDKQILNNLKSFLDKQIFRDQLFSDANWEIIHYVETVDKILYNLEKVLPNSYNYINKDNYYTCECFDCGWWGSSEYLNGGGQIADTGDYDDTICPICNSCEIDDKEEVQ